MLIWSAFGSYLPEVIPAGAMAEYISDVECLLCRARHKRHSTSEIYMNHGVSRDDLRQLFAHSSLSVTDRYVRFGASNLETVTGNIRLFDQETDKTDKKSG